jgi:hypothetical protein
VNKFIKKIDPYFNVIIYAEFLLKIIAMGFILGEGTYMSDPWNWIDFVVVASTFSELCLSLLYGGSNSFKMPGALRAIRLLRPLKLLNNIPALKRMILRLWLLSYPSLLLEFVGLLILINLLYICFSQVRCRHSVIRSRLISFIIFIKRLLSIYICL